MKDNYRKRLVDDKIESYLRIFGAVSIEGPKYCGKTWAARKHSKSEILFKKGNSYNENTVELAQIEPALVLEGEKPRLLDEWQLVPPIWDEVRYEVDKTGEKGQFILTESSTPDREGIFHSGAGRFGKIRLRTMSLYESGDSSGKVSLEDICSNKKISCKVDSVSLKTLAKLVIRGGWPANLGLSTLDSANSVSEYINLIVDNDVDRVDGIKRDKHKLKLLLKSLARNESTTVTNNTIRNDIKEKDAEDIDIDTVSSYLDVLNKLYLLDNYEPFSTNVRSSVRLKQSEKRHFADPSISCALLSLTEEKLINDLNTFGFMFEALVERDLKIYAETFSAKCYHYQDYQGREIDAIVELPDGDWCAFEIKLGANKIDEAAENLLSIKEEIRKEKGKVPKVLGVICGCINTAYVREDSVYVIPITALKN